MYRGAYEDRTDPRTQIRGLIEASHPPRASPARDAIRGLRSAASLKRPRPRPLALRIWSIRGLRSAASLKHQILRWVPRSITSPIRGLRSAASLKRSLPARRRKCAPFDPRTQIRGLIEATVIADPTGIVSGDPRTQIRGLIEAATRRSTSCSACGAIRGLRSAASLKPEQIPRVRREGRDRSADSDPRPH